MASRASRLLRQQQGRRTSGARPCSLAGEKKKATKFQSSVAGGVKNEARGEAASVGGGGFNILKGSRGRGVRYPRPGRLRAPQSYLCILRDVNVKKSHWCAHGRLYITCSMGAMEGRAGDASWERILRALLKRPRVRGHWRPRRRQERRRTLGELPDLPSVFLVKVQEENAFRENTRRVSTHRAMAPTRDRATEPQQLYWLPP